MEATLRRGPAIAVLVLTLCLAWSSPMAAQARDGWTIQLQGNAGYFKSTRDIGKILGTDVQAQIKTVLQAAPVFTMGVLLRSPSPHYSLRATAGYLSTDARGRAVGCDGDAISGPGCSAYDIPSTVMMGFFDVLLHNDEAGSSTLKYFIAGVGMRSYAFDEVGCRNAELDPILFNVCTPMEEFLADQVGLAFGLGIGVQGQAGPAGWNLEVNDMIGRFAGSGLRGEGGTQNDFVVSAGLTFPGG